MAHKGTTVWGEGGRAGRWGEAEVGDCGDGQMSPLGAGAEAGRVLLLFQGLGSLQVALALGQRLSKMGWVLHRGWVLHWGCRAGGAGTKGLLFPVAAVPVEQAGPGSRDWAAGTGQPLPLGREVDFPRKSRLFFHLSPQPGPGSPACSDVAAAGHAVDAVPRGQSSLCSQGRRRDVPVVLDMVLGAGSCLLALAEPGIVSEKGEVQSSRAASAEGPDS